MAEKKKSGLGKGLGMQYIFGSNVEKVLDDIQNGGIEGPGRRELEIPLEQIHANPYQPRKKFDEAALKELAESIKLHGVFTPVLVRESVQGYTLIAGERRLRAAKMAGRETIPAIVMEFTEAEMMEIALLENIQREDLNPIEEAVAYSKLIENLHYTQKELAERVGKSREYCANMLRLLKLPLPVQNLVASGKLTMGHVRPLLALSEDDIYKVADKIQDENMSVRAVERYVKDLSKDSAKKPVKKEEDRDPLIVDLEYRMGSKLGTKVSISGNAMNIRFSDTADLNRILDILGMIEE